MRAAAETGVRGPSDLFAPCLNRLSRQSTARRWGGEMAREHELVSSPETVHWGFMDATLPPILHAASGDRVTFHCLSGGPDVMPASGFAMLPGHREIHARLKP